MQDLLKDHMRRLRRRQNGNAVQNTGCLQLLEQKDKHSLPDMSQERNETRGIETQDTQGRALSRVSLHGMWSIPGLVSISADKERARGHMSRMRTGAMRSMRCCVAQKKIYGFGYIPLLLLRRREAHYMLGLQRTTACATTTFTETNEQEQAKSLHMQASARTHTEVPTPR